MKDRSHPVYDLRQVTSAIKQDGANQVSIITSSAEWQLAVAFAQTPVIRTNMIGSALREISQGPDDADALFDIWETQRTLDIKARLTLFVDGAKARTLGELLAARIRTVIACRRPRGCLINAFGPDYAGDHTANSLPVGSEKWKRRPPGNE